MSQWNRPCLPLIIALLVLMTIPSAQAGGIDLPVEALRDGETLYHENGAIKRAYLEQPVMIQGRVYEHWCWFDENGFLHQGVLAQDTPLGEIVLPAGTTMLLDADRPDRVLTWLAHDMDIEGLPVDGGGKINTRFDQSGRLRMAFLREDVTVQALPCEGGVFTPVEFDSLGRLIHCTLDRDADIRGLTYEAGTELWMDGEGEVVRSVPHPWIKRIGRDVLDLVF